VKHSFLDKYSDLNSPVHRLDPRVKLVVAFAFVLAVVTTPPGLWQVFVLYLALLWAIILISRVPPTYVLLRSLVIVPFAVVVAVSIPFLGRDGTGGSYSLGPWEVEASRYGLVVLWNVLIKSWLSVQMLTVLSSTTKLPDLLWGMRGLGMPKVMIVIMSFMYRYIFVLGDELLRMRRARDSRNFGGRRLWQWKTIGNMIGSLFIRSYERGERVYAAMLARGFDGEVRCLSPLRLRAIDVYCGVASLGAIVAVEVVPRCLSLA
jgi:cobalt/nickel transport system permease protein